MKRPVLPLLACMIFLFFGCRQNASEQQQAPTRQEQTPAPPAAADTATQAQRPPYELEVFWSEFQEATEEGDGARVARLSRLPLTIPGRWLGEKGTRQVDAPTLRDKLTSILTWWMIGQIYSTNPFELRRVVVDSTLARNLDLEPGVEAFWLEVEREEPAEGTQPEKVRLYFAPVVAEGQKQFKLVGIVPDK